MKRLKRGDIVEIKANKWRDSYGNTYHNVQVYVNDDYVGQSGNTYGYGDHYMQTAREMIFDKYKAPYGYDTSNPIYMLKDKGVKVTTMDSMVSRKRDLGYFERGGQVALAKAMGSVAKKGEREIDEGRDTIKAIRRDIESSNREISNYNRGIDEQKKLIQKKESDIKNLKKELLDIDKTVKNAKKEQIKFAKGGSVEDKEYVLEHYYVYVHRDSYEEGELDMVHSWDSSDYQENNQTFSSKSALMDFIKEVIDRDTYEDNAIDDYFMIDSDDDGTTIDYSVLCKYNDLDRGYDHYEKASDEEKEQWKKGDLELFSVGFTFKVKVYEPRKKAEFAKGGPIYEGHKVRIKDSGKTMKVTDISKNKKNQVEFSGDEGTYLIGDIEKMEKGGRILVGRFDEKQLKNKEDKKAIEKAQKESGLTYIDSKIIKKGGKMFMEVHLIPNEEYYKSSKFAKGGVPKGVTYEYPLYFGDESGRQFVAIWYTYDEDRNDADAFFDKLVEEGAGPDEVLLKTASGKYKKIDPNDLSDGEYELMNYALQTSSIQGDKVYFAKGGTITKKEGNEIFIGGLAGVLFGIFFGSK